MVKVLLVVLALVGSSVVASAGEVKESFDFAVDEWNELVATDGPVELDRIRIDRKEGRLTKSAVARPHNQEYLETVRSQLEYTNNSSRKWSSRIEVRWLDEEGRLIDGFSANENLDKKSTKKIVQASLST